MLDGRRMWTTIIALCATLVSTSAWVYQRHNVVSVEIYGLAPVIGADSAVKVGNLVYVRNLLPTDTVSHTYYLNDALRVTHNRVGTAKADSTTLPAPAYGLSSVYKGCVQVRRGTTKYPSSPLCWSWTYARSSLPIAIDSLIRISIRPKRIEVLAGHKAQFCAFGELKSGRRVTLDSIITPACDTLFQSYEAEKLS